MNWTRILNKYERASKSVATVQDVLANRNVMQEIIEQEEKDSEIEAEFLWDPDSI